MKKASLFLLSTICLFTANPSLAQDGGMTLRKTILHNANLTNIYDNHFSDELIGSDFKLSNRYWTFYKVNLKANDELYINYNSTAFATALCLADSAGNAIGRKEDTAKFRTISLLEVLYRATYDGSYYIELTTESPLTTGKYNIQIVTAGPESLKFPTDEDFCSKFEFLKMHKKAHYSFVLGDVIQSSVDLFGNKNYSSAFSIFENSEPIFNAFLLNLGGVTYKQKDIYKSTDLATVKKKFNEYVKLIKSCLYEDWLEMASVTEDDKLPILMVHNPDQLTQTIELKVVKNDDSSYSINFSF